MKKHIYILTGLFASFMLINQQSIAQSDVDVTIEGEETSSSSGYRRVAPIDMPDTIDPRLYNSDEIITIRNYLRAAVKLHNYSNTMLHNLVAVEGFKNIIAEHEFSIAQLAANESCNISLLSPYYHSPETVWQGISSRAYEIKNAEQPAIDTLREGFMDDYDRLGDNFLYNDPVMSRLLKSIRFDWDVGHRVLTDVYANQSNWGKKKYPFPLWEDQQYLYDSQWNRKYGEIKERLVIEYSHQETYRISADDIEYRCVLEGWVENVPDKGPSVADVYKYDHEDFDPKLGTQAVLKAHNAYVRLIQKRPDGLNLSVMHSPPKQLPPLKESLYYLTWNHSGGYEKHFTAYPGLPNVWTSFFNSGNVFYNQGREDHFYNPSPNPNEGMCPKYVHYNAYGSNKYGSEINPYVSYYTKSLASYVRGSENEMIRTTDAYPSNLPRVEFRGFRDDTYPFMKNRIQTYLENREHKENMDEHAKEADEEIAQINKNVANRLKGFGVDVPADFDIATLADYNNAIEQLKVRQQEFVGKARVIFDSLIPTEEHLVSYDLEEYHVFAKVFDMLPLDPDLIAPMDIDEIDSYPEDIIKSQARYDEMWDLIRALREPPTSPEVGCPIL